MEKTCSNFCAHCGDCLTCYGDETCAVSDINHWKILNSAGESVWINVEKQLPEKNEEVEVSGDYTPAGHGYPKAVLRDYHGSGKLEWSSTEWRGTVGIRQWRLIK